MARNNVAENAEYRRNYRRLKSQVWEIERRVGSYGNAVGNAIYRLVRERFGSRATEIGDADIEAAVEFVRALDRLVSDVASAAQLMSEHAEQERQREARAQRQDDWEDMMRSLRRLTPPHSKAPQLRLVPDCGRDLRGNGE